MHPQVSRSRIVRAMNASRARATIAVAVAAALPVHLLIIVTVSTGILALLVYAGIALPAVWSARPTRRKAAAEVLRQILTLVAVSRRETGTADTTSRRADSQPRAEVPAETGLGRHVN